MPKRTKNKEETYRFVNMIANKQGWKIHPDEDFLDALVDGLMINYNRYGYFSCPCRDAAGIREKDEDIICPCDYCRPDQEDYGHCYCGLYLTPEFHLSGEMPDTIPERRPEELD
ncbi:MAG: ferredoxin-thioredoxin reductase catalytic domain-containing protein [Candidatus Hodarchaeales archaeon]